MAGRSGRDRAAAGGATVTDRSRGNAAPPRAAFTSAERRLIARLRTPAAVQAYLNRLPYNTESDGETLRGFRGVVLTGTAHCLEATLFAAVTLEQHGYPPLVLSFESVDLLDHVIYVYRQRGRWGSIARSRDPGLHGRKPVFPTARALARSYLEPYIDFSGEARAFAVVDLRLLGRYDWRLSTRNVWKVERLLLDYPHRRLRLPASRVRALRGWYCQFRTANRDLKPVAYHDRHTWTPLPAHFRVAEGLGPVQPRSR
jgi:hypothetical protein